ncbi:MAG: PIN domain-containing protein [Solirubrobacterales bacterium]
MTAFVDTNVLIRHLTGDPPALAARASALLRAGRPLLLTDLVFAECIYVLESFYEVERGRAAELMRAAIALPAVRALQPDILLAALEIHERDGLAFVDAHLAALAQATGVGDIVSFDRGLDRVAGIRRIEP